VDLLRVLMLEDVASDAELIQHRLRQTGLMIETRRVQAREEFLHELEEWQPGLILADYSLPAFDGLEALALARTCCPDVPFIFVSGAIGEERAIQALKDGSTDYVLKDRLTRLVPAVQRALREVEERKKRLQAERVINATNALLALLPRRRSRQEYLQAVVGLLHEWTNCRCVGIRVLNAQQEIPYEAWMGFSQQFREAENWLSIQHDQCACVRVVKGSPERQDLPATTADGSFYTPNLPQFLGQLAPLELSRFRGRCAAEGFATLAIVPLRDGKRVLGAIHLADQDPGKLPVSTMQLVEELTPQIGEALRGLDIEEERRSNLETQTVVNTVLQLADQELSLDDLLGRSLDLVLSVPWLAAQGRGAIWLADAGTHDLTLAAKPDRNDCASLACSETGARACLHGSEATGRPDELPPILLCPGNAALPCYCLPLMVGARTLGVLAVGVEAGHRRDQREEDFLLPVATALSGAIFREQSEKALRQRGQRLQMLHEIDRAILNAQSPAGIAQSVVRQVRDVISAQRVSVLLCDAQSQDLELVAVDAGGPTTMLPGQWLTLAAFRKLFSVRRPDGLGEVEDLGALAERTPVAENLLAEHVRAYAALPLVVDGETIGYLGLGDCEPGPFVPERLEIVRQVADSLAVAIQNARLFEQVKLSRRRLQELSRRLVEIQEDERRAIARELHDEAGQSLTTVMIGLGLLKQEVGASEVSVARIAELQCTTDRVMDGLHRLAANLRPASLDKLGLIPALRHHLTESARQNGLAVNLETTGLDEKLRFAPEVETTIYRIAQEALTNVARHANATEVGIILTCQEDGITMIIEDDGVGFDVAKAMQCGRLGLLGMRERAEMLEGSLTIESNPGTGTAVFVHLPS
jgi:signal transduction histidine kinase/CheY-like chemotaxis protein